MMTSTRYRSEPADGNWAILLSRPENSSSGTTGTPTKWRVDFGNYHDTTNTGAIATAYAVCEEGRPAFGHGLRMLE